MEKIHIISYANHNIKKNLEQYRNKNNNKNNSSKNITKIDNSKIDTVELEEDSNTTKTQGAELVGITNDEYIKLLGPIAQADYAKTGIFASVTIAQAIYEGGWPSNWDPSNPPVGIKNNNIFGIINSSEYSRDNKSYMKFDSIEEGIEEHSKLFTDNNNYYPNVMTEHNSSPKDFLEYIIPIYAPESDGNEPDQYIADCLSIIDKYNLTQYDVK